MNRRGLLALPLALFAILESTPAPQDTPPLDTGIVERTGRSLMLLDVDVVDKQGRPVTGLTKEDFAAWLDGKAQEIYSLDDLCPVVEQDITPETEPLVESESMTPQAPSPPPEPLSYVLYFDFSQLGIDGRQQALDEARRWIRETREPGDAVTIAAYADRVGHAELIPLTTDGPLLLEALEKVEDDISFFDEFAASLESRIEMCCARCGEAAPLCCKGCCPTGFRQCRVWAREEYQRGRRSYEALRLFIEGLEAVPGRKALILFNQNGTQLPEKLYGIPNLSHTEQVEALGAEANQTGTRLYTARVGNTRDHQSWVGGYATNLGISLADYTGGGYNRGATDLAALIDTAGRESICVYRIGLRAPRDAGARIYTARVEVRGEALDGRYRIQFLSEGDRWMRRARNALRRAEQAEDIYAVAAVVPIAARGGRWNIEVKVAVDANSLERVRGTGRKFSRRWEVGALLTRDEGEKSWEMLGVSTAVTATEGSRQIPVVHERTFERLPPGRYELRAFVRDRWANVYGGGRTIVELPKPREGALVGPFVLRAAARHATAALPLRTTRGVPQPSAGRIRKGPLPFGARAVVAGEPLEFVTWVCAGDHKDSLDQTRRILLRDGLPVLDLEDPRVNRAGECATILDELNTSRLGPGEYVYTLTWAPGGKPEQREATVRFKLVSTAPFEE